MTRTQIQLPDALYREVKRIAAEREMSLAELVRRALETLLCHFPAHPEPRATWELPKPRPLGGDTFFENPDWRYEINAGGGEVREKRTPYRAKRKGKKT
jgi:Ribbon-helix-helix protein, copG family